MNFNPDCIGVEGGLSHATQKLNKSACVLTVITLPIKKLLFDTALVMTNTAI